MLKWYMYKMEGVSNAIVSKNLNKNGEFTFDGFIERMPYSPMVPYFEGPSDVNFDKVSRTLSFSTKGTIPNCILEQLAIENPNTTIEIRCDNGVEWSESIVKDGKYIEIERNKREVEATSECEFDIAL